MITNPTQLRVYRIPIMFFRPAAIRLCLLVFVCVAASSALFFPRLARASGFGDVDDAEEEAHPWEKEDLQQHLKDERLFDAVVANDRKLVRVSLKIGAHHHHHKNGYTPLHMAAWLDHPDICDMLIAAGAHLEQKDKYGRTALTIASIQGAEHCARSLVEAGADLETAGRDAHHTHVVGHAQEAAAHPDATDKHRRLHTYLKQTRDDMHADAKQKRLADKKQAKEARAAARAAKAEAEL